MDDPQAGGALTQFGGLAAFAATIAGAVAGGIASALNFRGRLTEVEKDVEAIKGAAASAPAALRDELLGKLADLETTVKRELAAVNADRDPSSRNVTALVNIAIKDQIDEIGAKHEKRLDGVIDKIDRVRDRVSEIGGSVDALIKTGGRR